MSTISASPSATTPRVESADAVKPAKRWLVGPWFDLFFLANLAWPVAVLLYWLRLFDQSDFRQPLGESIEIIFFQVYFLSTPHRWITLVLVFCDSDRFWKEPAKFGGIGLAMIGLGLALVLVTINLPTIGSWVGLDIPLRYVANSLILLTMLDYVWNAWHFASQHAGISRIYGRMTRPVQAPAHGEFEKMALRTLVLWVFFRFAVHMALQTDYGDGIRWLAPWLHWLDPLAMLPVIILIAREVGAFRPESLGRCLYIGSVVALYSAQLFAIRVGSLPWMFALFFASAIFHAIEYLAICNWSVQKRTTGIWQYQISRTGIALLAFMFVLGLANYLVNAQSIYVWQLLTLLVSLLHYAYDGIIWKAKPAKPS